MSQPIPHENTNKKANKAKTISTERPNSLKAFFLITRYSRKKEIGTSSGANMTQKFIPGVKNAKLGNMPPACDAKLKNNGR